MLESRVVKFAAGFARPFLGCIFPNFCGVIWFYEIKLEVEVDFCMFLVVYMFSKQISCWNRIGRQLLGGFELADELAGSFSPVFQFDFHVLYNGAETETKCRICTFPTEQLTLKLSGQGLTPQQVLVSYNYRHILFCNYSKHIVFCFSSSVANYEYLN